MPRIVSILQRGQLGLTKPNRPRGSFLFLGPTGVGKTETALAFTTHLFGEGRLFRFHPKLGARPMRDAVEKLVGDAVAVDLLTSGTGNGLLLVDEPGNCLVVRPAAAPVHSAEEHSQV